LLDFRDSSHQLAEKLELALQPEDETTTGMRFVPHGQTLIVQGNMEQHETLQWLLKCLHHAVAPRNCARSCKCRTHPGGINRFERTVRSSAESKIEAALRDHTQVEFIETPLQDVIDFLKDLHSIEIQIDTRALEDVGIGSDSPITMNLKGVSLRSALRLMLRQLDLTYVICDEVLLIIPVALPESTTTRVYSVAELLNSGETADELAKVLLVALARPDNPRAVASAAKEQKKKGPPKLRIVPYRQAIIVVGNSDMHQELRRLLHELSLGLQGRTSPRVVPERASTDRTDPAQQRSRKARAKRRNRSAGKSKDNKETPKRGRGKDPFAGPATDPSEWEPAADPFGAKATQEKARSGSTDDKDPFGGGGGKAGGADPDPFGGGADDEDPFAGGGADADPFGGGAGDEDPFGGSHGEDPFR
jgi:hypothetical protein